MSERNMNHFRHKRMMPAAFLCMIVLLFPAAAAAGTYEVVLKSAPAGDILEAGRDLARLYGMTIEYQVGSTIVVTTSDATARSLSSDGRVERITARDAGPETTLMESEEADSTAEVAQPEATPQPVPTLAASNNNGLQGYVMVLQPPSFGEEPDVETLGGRRTPQEWKNRRVVQLPPQAVEALRQNPRVKYLQELIDAGTPDDRVAGADDSAPRAVSSNGSGTLTSNAITSATWNSGVYKYDGAGNIINIGNDYYLYDGLGRLVEASVTSGGARDVEKYTYDAFGNMTSRTSTVGEGSQTLIGVDATTNRLTGVPYDHAGNITAIGNWEYFWGPFNTMYEMARAFGTGGHQDYYIYSASDERIGTLYNGQDYWRWTIRDLRGKVLREFESWDDPNASWMWISDHVYRDGNLAGAERPAEEGGRRHFALDHLGTPRMITNQLGQALARHDYTPFGIEVSSMMQEPMRGYSAEPMKFTGHERDFNGGQYVDNVDTLDYMHARYYTAVLGRFLSVDPKRSSARPAMPQTWNRYSYVINNPLKYIDEKGEDITLVVRAPGDGATNFGHVAVRVHGKGYDRTYDFGRYRGTWGFKKSQGEGILRVWTNNNAFMTEQQKKGNVQTLTWQTSAKTDQAVMGVFSEKIVEGEKIATTSDRTSYKLADNYFLLGNNCTTITMDAIATGAAATGAQLDEFDRVRDELDPEDVYDEVERIRNNQ